MEMDERDVVVFTDEDGNEIELDVIDYFEHEDQEYAVLVDIAEEAEEDDEEMAQEVYIMKVVVTDEVEEFVPPDEELYDVLTAIVEKRLSCECDGEEGECECDCHNKE